MCLTVVGGKVREGPVLPRHFQVEKQFDAGQHIFASKQNRRRQHSLLEPRKKLNSVCVCVCSSVFVHFYFPN